MTESGHEAFEPRVRLTDAEWQVLEALRSGGSLRQAADDLAMPVRRLRLHVANVAEKLRIVASA